jgi:cytidylate kinase
MAIVTISRGTFSGGLMLANELSGKLNYRCVGREEVVAKAAKKYGVSEEKLLAAILKKPSAFRRFTYDRDQYLSYVRAVLCEQVRADHVIYHGNAGHFLLKGVPHVLRIRVVAPMELRIKFVMDRQQLLRPEAVQYIEKVDKERIKWTKFLYGVDWRSPELFDIVFNLETENTHFICQMVECAVQQEPFKTTQESQKVMDDLTLASLVRAEIASHPETRNVEIVVKADSGGIVLRGKVKTQEAVNWIGKIAGGVPGVKEVRNQVSLDYRYQYIET